MGYVNRHRRSNESRYLTTTVGPGHDARSWRFIERVERALGLTNYNHKFPRTLTAHGVMPDGRPVRLVASRAKLHSRHNDSRHRLQILCDQCNTWIPAGRIQQHEGTAACYRLRGKGRTTRDPSRRKRGKHARVRITKAQRRNARRQVPYPKTPYGVDSSWVKHRLLKNHRLRYDREYQALLQDSRDPQRKESMLEKQYSLGRFFAREHGLTGRQGSGEKNSERQKLVYSDLREHLHALRKSGKSNYANAFQRGVSDEVYSSQRDPGRRKTLARKGKHAVARVKKAFKVLAGKKSRSVYLSGGKRFSTKKAAKAHARRASARGAGSPSSTHAVYRQGGKGQKRVIVAHYAGGRLLKGPPHQWHGSRYVPVKR